MKTIDKLNAHGKRKGFANWDDYLQWMISVMSYNSEQITERIITAIEWK